MGPYTHRNPPQPSIPHLPPNSPIATPFGKIRVLVVEKECRNHFYVHTNESAIFAWENQRLDAAMEAAPQVD